jgi:hypothetical protein
MRNENFERCRASICRCIEKRCLDCKSERPCPAFIVIAMRSALEVAASSVREK